MHHHEYEDVYGRALYDYYSSGEAATLYLHTSYGILEEMPVDWFFRDEEDFPSLEWKALKLAQGKTLDIGAGVGSHAVYLNNKGIDVWALDNSPYCAKVMKARGLNQVLCQSIWDSLPNSYDCLLLLMNGIGIVNDIEGLRKFLRLASKILNPGGSILFDSSDLTYLHPDLDITLFPYLGEVLYQYEYKGQKGQAFSWLYIDPKTMRKFANEAGWSMEVIYTDDKDQYLARLWRQ